MLNNITVQEQFERYGFSDTGKKKPFTGKVKTAFMDAVTQAFEHEPGNTTRLNANQHDNGRLLYNVKQTGIPLKLFEKYVLEVWGCSLGAVNGWILIFRAWNDVKKIPRMLRGQPLVNAARKICHEKKLIRPREKTVKSGRVSTVKAAEKFIASLDTTRLILPSPMEATGTEELVHLLEIASRDSGELAQRLMLDHRAAVRPDGGPVLKATKATKAA